MQNLERLHLQRTAITDAGLKSLPPLADLYYLNLHSTAITDDGLATLRSLPKLRQVYLWETKVTPAAVQGFAEARADRAQLKIWQDEIEALQAKIRDQRILIETGAPASTSVGHAKRMARSTRSVPSPINPLTRPRPPVSRGNSWPFAATTAKLNSRKTQPRACRDWAWFPPIPLSTKSQP